MTKAYGTPSVGSSRTGCRTTARTSRSIRTETQAARPRLTSPSLQRLEPPHLRAPNPHIAPCFPQLRGTRLADRRGRPPGRRVHLLSPTRRPVDGVRVDLRGVRNHPDRVRLAGNLRGVRVDARGESDLVLPRRVGRPDRFVHREPGPRTPGGRSWTPHGVPREHPLVLRIHRAPGLRLGPVERLRVPPPCGPRPWRDARRGPVHALRVPSAAVPRAIHGPSRFLLADR